MKKEIKLAIERYQCSGCERGSDISCFEPKFLDVGCGKHCPGTIIVGGIGRILLGLPNGFNRIGKMAELPVIIYETFESDLYDKFNIPVWKHLTKDGHVLVRGLRPRKNEPFLHIFLENCLERIACYNIIQSDIDEMD